MRNADFARKRFLRDTDVWNMLKNTDRPIAVYGTGNGADKLFEMFALRNIPIAAVFASDGFVRRRSFRSYEVLSYDAALRQCGDSMIIAVAFASSRPEVMENIARLSARHTVVMPPLPVVADCLENEIFDLAYYHAHMDEIDAARALLADADSRRCFDDIIDYRLSGELLYLDDAVWQEEETWKILKPLSFRRCADLGAYTGDTIAALCRQTAKRPEIIAMEPDARTFAKLTANCPEAECYHAAAWNTHATLQFAAKSNRGSSAMQQGSASRMIEVSAEALDTLLDGRSVDYIKYDVEGAEAKALEGSRHTIAAFRPALLISLYHRTADFFRLPLYLQTICADYRMYLRRTVGYPDWDLNLLAVVP